MTFDREPDLDNANVGMPDTRHWERKKIFTEAIKSVASVFVGALMNDKSVYESAKIAADYTVKCIINTQGDTDHWYGAKFETALGDLMKMLA